MTFFLGSMSARIKDAACFPSAQKGWKRHVAVVKYAIDYVIMWMHYQRCDLPA